MALREINYEKILYNIEQTLNALEYSGERSGGKVKQAVLEINALYEYKERIEKMLAPKSAPVAKAAPKVNQRKED